MIHLSDTSSSGGRHNFIFLTEMYTLSRDAWFPFKWAPTNCLCPKALVRAKASLETSALCVIWVPPYPTKHMGWVVVPMVSRITAGH